jgi:dGTPase
VHDVEDGIHAGLIDLTALQDADTAATICDLVATTYLPGTDPGDLGAALDRLVCSPAWPAGYSRYTGSLRDLAALKDLTSQLIGRFTAAAEAATREAHPQGQLTRYSGSLEVPADIRHEVGVLKGIANLFVMQRRGSTRSYARQRAMISELVTALSATAPGSLEPHFRPTWEHADGDGARLRVVVDQVASLTDISLVAWHKRHCRP